MDISTTDLDKLLAEVASYCPSYPVQKMFEILMEKKEAYEPINGKELTMFK